MYICKIKRIEVILVDRSKRKGAYARLLGSIQDTKEELAQFLVARIRRAGGRGGVTKQRLDIVFFGTAVQNGRGRVVEHLVVGFGRGKHVLESIISLVILRCWKVLKGLSQDSICGWSRDIR